MAAYAHRSLCFAAAVVLVSTSAARTATSQVFVVGEKTATAGVDTGFTPTRVDLPSGTLSERGRRELIRNLEAEQGFAHRALPLGAGLTLIANGHLTPGAEQYKRMLYEKGTSAGPGDRVMVTNLTIKADRLILDLNGGPYAKHRFLSHVSLNDNPVVQQPVEQPTGARITLVFEGKVPEISAPEVKALLEPLVDFGVKSSEQAYADTLPQNLKDAIAAHDVLVGMNHRMVLAALGAPESKMRERDGVEGSGTRYEEWIYGHVPQTVRFIRFKGDRVAQVEIAELGKPLAVHDKDEMGAYTTPVETREIVMGDVQQGVAEGTHAAGAPPSLRKPGEAAPPSGSGQVQFPSAKPAQSGSAGGASTPSNLVRAVQVAGPVAP